MTPPTIAPVLEDRCSKSADDEFNVGDVETKPVEIAELGAEALDICANDVVGCETVLATVALSEELEPDLVIASTMFGIAKRISVLASGPQAIYSND